jgi:hypothetical protein
LQPNAVTYNPAGDKGGAYVSLTYPNGVEVHHNRPKPLRPEKPSVAHGDAIQILADGQAKEGKPVSSYKGQGGIYGDFIDCVKTREKPFRDIELAVNTMTGPHMIAIAYRLERSLKWDRDAQQFTGDEEANRLVDRARREPWIL